MTVYELFAKLKLSDNDLSYIMLCPKKDGIVHKPYDFKKPMESYEAYIKRIFKCKVISYEEMPIGMSKTAYSVFKRTPIKVVFEYIEK